MLNIRKFNIVFMAILAFILSPIAANANLGGYVITGGEPSPPPTYYYPEPTPVYYPQPVPEPVPVYISTPAPTPTVYSNSTNPNPPKKVVAKATKKTTETNSQLTANAIYGSNSFLPSGLIQWILFGILVLLIVLLVRKMYGADKRYHETPLKHD